jgi:nucleoid-associated protein YgaU
VSLISFGREAGIELPGTEGTPLCRAVAEHLGSMGLRARQLELSHDRLTGVMRVGGCAPDQDTRERIVLCCGNVRGVAGVDDRMTVEMPSEASRWRFVQPGDTLARIARDFYRDERRAPQLRAANQPLIGDALDLQPGWLLRMPA